MIEIIVLLVIIVLVYLYLDIKYMVVALLAVWLFGDHVTGGGGGTAYLTYNNTSPKKTTRVQIQAIASPIDRNLNFKSERISTPTERFKKDIQKIGKHQYSEVQVDLQSFIQNINIGDRFNRFLERNKLKDIKGCDRILKDVIEDRFSLEKDGVLTFESYKVFESDEFKISSMKECLYKGIEKSTTKMEKILADYFDTNLSDIDIEDSSKHKFKINDEETNYLNKINIYNF